MMNIKEDFVPMANSNRPGTRINPVYITIHETANRSKGANAETHARYIKGAEAQKRQVSWHFTVDDKQIIQHLQTNEMGWHAGANGNRQSIGIELCVNSDGDFEKTKANAQWLIKKLMEDLNIPLSRVVTHKHWTGKTCPAILLSTFEQFKQGVVSVANRVDANVVYQGKQVKGFVEGGRTYVQVRDLADLVGLKIGWEQQSKTVTLSK